MGKRKQDLGDVPMGGTGQAGDSDSDDVRYLARTPRPALDDG
jgi:hypothetical protein